MTDSYTFAGRVAKPWSKKLNPIWWWQNDDQQTVDQAPWYHPNWPEWRRALIWNVFRNPLQNFRAYVVGVQDRNYVVTGKAPVLTIQRNDLVPPQTGYQWCILHTMIPLGFVSYSGKHVVWYAGWQPNGFFGFKFNLV
jgi:hypothetical protein